MNIIKRFKTSRFAKTFQKTFKKQEELSAGEMLALFLLLILVATYSPVLAAQAAKDEKAEKKRLKAEARAKKNR